MLKLTNTAVEAVRTITAREDTPPDAGLRIYTVDGSGTLQLAVAAEPADQDQVVLTDGSRVFLDEQAAALLDDKVLDTALDANGRGTFFLADQDRLAGD
ncbi:hypothetical protein [Nocardia stercoris]|uniref:Fe-S cluster assembly protein HesB n=1 Tax=Nocardia stercoris TaxID=2483361 RepID=A0A3M2L479_9NOCA|nr:hypothetical protein [Nocardia stercoris]RMI31313.1 hypothetical protein EBN03_18290 [Nocardia stercoris]